jgi:hypothetical protein
MLVFLPSLLLLMRALLAPQVLVESGGYLWERELGPPAMPLFRKQASLLDLLVQKYTY